MAIKSVQNTTQVTLLSTIEQGTNNYETAFVSMRNHKRIEINIVLGICGAIGDIQMLQATTVAGTGSKELIINTGNVYESDPAAADGAASKWTTSTVTLPGAAGSEVSMVQSKTYKVEIRNDQLDSANDFDCIALKIEGTQTTALMSIHATLHDGRYQGEPNNRNIVPSPLINQEATEDNT